MALCLPREYETSPGPAGQTGDNMEFSDMVAEPSGRAQPPAIPDDDVLDCLDVLRIAVLRRAGVRGGRKIADALEALDMIDEVLADGKLPTVLPPCACCGEALSLEDVDLLLSELIECHDPGDVS